jgi:hypothetical protein
MIMNKKIFTLLVGALLSIGSLFTASAQTQFADTLRADTVKEALNKDGVFYLLSVTEIANPSASVQTTFSSLTSALNVPVSQKLSYVLFVDAEGQLRMDRIDSLDHNYEGALNYNGSAKLGAIRHASWCVEPGTWLNDGANRFFEFTNLNSNIQLQAPLVNRNSSNWTSVSDADGVSRLYYKTPKGIDLDSDEDLIVSGWRFSQSISPSMQTGMPLYSYVEPDSVLVFVIDEDQYEYPNGTSGVGGWKVSVKYVAVNDLIRDAVGNVRRPATDSKYVSNVLLFTLKKLEKFVLNANDYNAISDKINFVPDAKNEKAENDGWNPFTTPGNNGTDPHAQGPLTAYEVKDSLYKYGYLQFENSGGEWLYVDTAFWNYGNGEFLAFKWSDHRRDTTDLGNNVSTDDWGKGYWGGSDAGTPLGRALDSIMENQSKFRVVYDPYNDETFINVYQSRYLYADYKNPLKPVEYPWWTNSFRLDTTGGVTKILSPTGGNNSFQGDGGFPYNNNYQSAPKGMDTVLISTADTTAAKISLDGNGSGYPVSYLYGWNQKTNGTGSYYRDTLLYVNIQNTEKGGHNIATLTQSNAFDAQIRLGFDRCKADESVGRATIKDNLYLIRNAKGEYLCVPIFSITDSVYWRTPETYEDPTRMPSYQWVVENKRASDGSPFRLTNREFENVSFDYVFVYANGDSCLKIGDPAYSGAKFAKEKFAIIRSKTSEDSVGLGNFSKAEELGAGGQSFIRLAADVKGDQTLGYRYINKDSAYIDVYAFKYYHFLATGGNANYMGWNGYESPKVDTVVYLNMKDYHDKLYFTLLEMPYENIGEDRVLIGKTPEGKDLKDLKDYESIYDIYTSGDIYQNRDSIVMEKFGYMPTTRNAKGETVYDYKRISGLKPLARQAYRLLLKDYYKFDPLPNRGAFLTVGQQDDYILSDRAYATKPHVQGSDRAEGVFGLPYFYFRNTYFGIPGVDGTTGEDAKEDYFALVQRLDTISLVDGFTSKYADVEEYISLRWGPEAASRVTNQIRGSKELGAFIATVADNSTKMKIAVRGDIAVAPSTFTLERDTDPLYRRFHWNDRFEKTEDDKPLVLEFHRLNNSDYRLFENSGYDIRSGGGYEYNLNKKGKPQIDSLGNEISFLGIKNISQFPSTDTENPHGLVNYAFYVDTAYINRGTGWIKPQYMLAVDYKVVDACEVCLGDQREHFRGYTIGRYVYNTSMYAKKVVPSATDKVVNYDLVQPVDVDVIHAPWENGVDGYAYTRAGNTKWERLAFAWAIHRGDSLYVLKNLEPWQGQQYDPQTVIDQLARLYVGTKGNIDFNKLIESKGKSKKELDKEFEEVVGPKIGLHAIISLDDNTHKDWVFSFRYIQRRADDFIIESETTERDRVNGDVIRPGYGGWVKYDNGVPIITRSDTKELLGEGYITNVTKSEIEPVANDPVETASGVKIVGGYGAVTVLNAAGKNITITNVIGQVLANTVAGSDNVSIAVDGNNTIVFVSVDGGSAEKALVK